MTFQTGIANYGVRDASANLDEAKLAAVATNEQVRMFEINPSRGAKPGKSGISPEAKVTGEIARISAIAEGEDPICPNRNPAIDSAEDPLVAIARVRRVAGKPFDFEAPTDAYGGLNDLCPLIKQLAPAHGPDVVIIDSADDGTRAAQASLVDDMGLSLNESLRLVADVLNRHGLCVHARIIASGKLTNPGQVAQAMCAGADLVVSARRFMLALGCVHTLQCYKNTCPTGIITRHPRLQ